ncbi:uncharacterized protein BX663DRAFT_548574 [Cokeromyces recurvatus]|uniref:uncharacterized protein n=1 Tax=Cokeromyces recurvatus TaxID=90255 RepID=UPI00221FBFD3|nr:uncharacterized protein BX663DRAFT_548574 [Cokeromyces recurvatus]KAI7906386.1 hypothetical protein BX663DRAFT_548574 [Cokeromyces recurvatus]
MLFETTYPFDTNNKFITKENTTTTIMKQYYDSEDDEETLATAIDDLSSLILYPSHSTTHIELFQDQMQDPTNLRISQCQNTYFMDGGVRFISLPTLGTSNTKATTPISRIFEEWLANKLYSHPNKTVNLNSNTMMMTTIEDESSSFMINDHLPILEDNIELISEDIINMFKSRKRLLKGLSNILIKVRTGHVYSYHQLENGQPIITEDMEDFFQQFPLFVEILIYATQSEQNHNEINLLLITENTTLTSNLPYKIMENIQL